MTDKDQGRILIDRRSDSLYNLNVQAVTPLEPGSAI